jgi:uncharacterized membrane protein YphA (DoxX/SURF4 family)
MCPPAFASYSRWQMPPLLTTALWSARHGRGLLILRLALVVCLVADGRRNVLAGVAAANDGSGVLIWIAGVALIVCGALIGVGFLTPIVPIVVIVMGLTTLADHLLMLNVSFTAMNSWQTVLLEMAIAAALMMIGPGSYSLDAYLFGYKEINIPSRISSSNPQPGS